MNFKVLQTDILIVGAGGAGLRAAIEAHDNGSKVIVVSKSLIGKAHTVMAEGGISAALGNVDSEDNWKVHFADTMREGQFLSDYRMVEILVKEVPERIYELERWGAIFDRTPDGKIMQRTFGAHKFRRACHVGDRIGLELLRTLQDQVFLRNIEFKEEVLVTKILTKNKTIVGATALDMKTGELLVFNCKAIILATGGCGKIFKVSTNSWDVTGDGMALAYEAGAELMDMEMIQFHPTAMVYPRSVRGMLVTEAIRGEGGILLNALGERFMEKIDPKRIELSARDIIARALYNEVKEGRGTKNGGVYLDITHKGKKFILKKLPRMYAQFIEFADVDITKEKMEVAPAVHYMMGGIKIDAEACQSSVQGLFAAGEVASGVHGANRLGGNSLADILVFGKRTGKAASEYANKSQFEKINFAEVEKEFEKISKPFEISTGIKPTFLRAKIHDIMWEKVGIIRNEHDLQSALKEIQNLKKEAQNMQVTGPKNYNPAWLAAIDVQNMLIVCEMIIRSALFRKESRGAHFREDFPKQDEKWLVNIICKKGKNGKTILTKSKVLEIPEDLKKILEENNGH